MMNRVLIAHEDNNGKKILFLFGSDSSNDCLQDIQEFMKCEKILVKHCKNENDLFDCLAKF